MRLTEPGHIGTMATKNRVVMAAMGIRGTTDKDGVDLHPTLTRVLRIRSDPSYNGSEQYYQAAKRL